MIQVRPFVIANAGTKPYWCLQNVRLGYGIGPKHGYALQDWQNNIQHPDKNYPAGCSVPVYFNWSGTVEGEYRNWGHIAVRLADGRIWTDGKYFSNVQELSTNYLRGGAYLGWGELVEGVKVVTQGDTSMAETINDDSARQIGWHYLGRNGYDGKSNALQAPQGDIQGKPLTNAQLSAFFLSAESREWRDSRIHKVYAERDALKATNENLNSQITGLTKDVAEKQKTIETQSQSITELNEVVAGQKLEISELNEQVKRLTAENKALKEYIAEGGQPPVTPETDSVTISKDNVWQAFINWVNRVFKSGK